MITIKDLEHLLSNLKLLAHFRARLTDVRRVYESDEDTFNRIMEIASSRICKRCRGYGRPIIESGVCADCDGTGLYDPVLAEARKALTEIEEIANEEGIEDVSANDEMPPGVTLSLPERIRRLVHRIKKV
jgi:hypothetical protein